jgi:hypothetical protein
MASWVNAEGEAAATGEAAGLFDGDGATAAGDADELAAGAAAGLDLVAAVGGLADVGLTVGVGCDGMQAATLSSNTAPEWLMNVVAFICIAVPAAWLGCTGVKIGAVGELPTLLPQGRGTNTWPVWAVPQAQNC